MEEFKIHPNNFALARAIAGDPSDNLPGVPGVGLKTVAKRFPFLINEEESDCKKIVTNCAMQGKKLKLHENIIKSEDIIKNNYKIMQLYSPNIRPVNRIFIDNAIINFKPEFSKLNLEPYRIEFSENVKNIEKMRSVIGSLSITEKEKSLEKISALNEKNRAIEEHISMSEEYLASCIEEAGARNGEVKDDNRHGQGT